MDSGVVLILTLVVVVMVVVAVVVVCVCVCVCVWIIRRTSPLLSLNQILVREEKATTKPPSTTADHPVSDA